MLHGAVAVAALLFAADDKYFQDPHPLRTLYRGPVLRLLDDPNIRLNLDLNSQQSAKLVEFLRELDRKQDDLFTKTEDDFSQRLELLRNGVEERQRKFLHEFETAVGHAARRKLVAAAVNVWGDLAPFAVGVAEELGVSKSQRSAAEAAVQRSQHKQMEMLQKLPPPKPEDLELVAEALSHDLAKILTVDQKKRRDEIVGPKPTQAVQLFVDKEAAREERESRPPVKVIHRDPRRLMRLVQIDDVLDLLKIHGEERRSLVKWTREKTVEEEALASLKKQDADTLHVRTEKLAQFDERTEKALAERLGPSRFERLNEIRWQLGGVGAAFGDSLRKELGVSDGQFHTALAKLQAAAEKGAAEDAAAADEAEMAKRGTRRQQEYERLLLDSLTDDQRKKWRRLLGEPIDKNVLSRIQRRL